MTKKPPKHEDSPDEYDCDVCGGTGYICENCNAIDGECTCEDGPELVPCPEACGVKN